MSGWIAQMSMWNDTIGWQMGQIYQTFADINGANPNVPEISHFFRNIIPAVRAIKAALIRMDDELQYEMEDNAGALAAEFANMPLHRIHCLCGIIENLVSQYVDGSPSLADLQTAVEVAKVNSDTLREKIMEYVMDHKAQMRRMRH